MRAILEGRKTVTRRALNAHSLKNIGYGVQLGECHELPTDQHLIAAFAGTVAWMLLTFGFIIHIIKTARPTAGGGR